MHAANFIARSERRFDVWHEVPLVPQSTGMSCWAAAAAMVVGWRDRVALEPGAIADRLADEGAFSEGLLPHHLLELARAWQLAVEPAQDLTVEQLRALLVRVGPLWVGEASPGLHALVITGMFGDGSADATFVRINDPWPVHRGERYVLSFRELMANFRAATEAVGIHAQLLHAGGRGHGSSSSFSVSERHIVTKPKEGIMQTQVQSARRINGHAALRPRGLNLVAAGERYVNTASFPDDPLAAHGGTGENLCLRWNELGSDIGEIDLVVHLHGYVGRDPDRAMLEQRVRLSGLDLSGRARPTLGLIPRGRRITAEERQRNPSANPARYTFGGLSAGDGAGLERLMAQSLAWFCREVLGRPGESLTVARVIFTAHSGGGAALNALLRSRGTRRACDPHEVFVFDGIYGEPGQQGDGIVPWATAHLAAGDGALRILFGRGTQRGSEWIAARLTASHPAFRVEYAGEDHNAIPNQHGRLLLANAAADLTLPAAQGLGLSPAYGTPVGLFQQIPSRAVRPLALGRATAPFPTRSEAEIDALGSERGSGAMVPAAGLAISVRALATWAGDSVSPDYRHLRSFPGICQPFSFGADQLAQLAAANRFALPETGRIVFGLRGCRIVEPNDGAFHTAVTLEDDVPDHVSSRCVIGVWSRDTGQIAVFRGSTVPNETKMRGQINDPRDKANLLLTGLHRFRVRQHVGEHRTVNGVLGEFEPKLVLRSRDDLIFTTSDDFVVAEPGDNIHPSFRPGQDNYSSAGCLTVRGDASAYNEAAAPDTHIDPSDGTPGWRTFRERLGLTPDHAPEGENGRTFVFVLLTGREAFLASQSGTRELGRLRVGSSGDEVRALQEFLQRQPSADMGRYDGALNGTLDPTTALAFVRFQRFRDRGVADGIVSPADSADTGIQLTRPFAYAGVSRAKNARVGAIGRATARILPGEGYPHRARRVPQRAVALVDSNSPQAEQSEAVRRNVADSIGRAETNLQFDLVHDDSSRVNFGIGSWTGARIADLLDTYESVATELGRLDAMYGYFAGQPGFDAVRTRMRTGGASAVLSATERGQLATLGRDVPLQEAQIRHLAGDVERALSAIGNSESTPWYPFIDGGMGAITELAAHILVHAGHQGNRQSMVRDAVAHFGGEAALGRSMVDGTVTEADFLLQVGEQVVSRVAARYQTGVRNRYARLLRDYGSSTLSYYFNPV